MAFITTHQGYWMAASWLSMDLVLLQGNRTRLKLTNQRIIGSRNAGLQ